MIGIWVGFSLAIVALLGLAHRSLALAMFVAAGVLAAFTLSGSEVIAAVQITFTDSSVLLLALIVGMIPLIGGALELSGELGRLVENMRIGKRPFLALAPALFGMLPMPGGALLSAPLIERGAGSTKKKIKAAANVWFRHGLLLVYPLCPALIASAKIAGLDIYSIIIALSPAFLLTMLLGYGFLLRGISGRVGSNNRFSLRGLLVPLGIILAAPAIDLLLKNTVASLHPPVTTAIGVTVSLVLAIGVGRLTVPDLRHIASKMKPWKFSLIILAMFIFLNIFKVSGAPALFADLHLSPVLLGIVGGFLLGLITGRLQTPVSIIVPIYITQHGAMSSAAFAVIYFAIYLGYVVSPVHPCISVSLEYFDTSLRSFLRAMAPSTGIALLLTLILGMTIL